MRIGFNLPEAVENITITFEGHGKKKEYHFKNTEIQMFHDDRRLSNYINSFIGPDWPKSMIGKKSPRSKVQAEIGIIADLIAAMSFKGATEEEIRNATKYSAILIESGKNESDRKKACEELNIEELKAKYLAENS